MADGSKVRLVRCPKCDNLLPELPEYSVYQCGGCGTILRAKKRNPGSDVLSEKSDEEKGFGGSSEKLVNSVIEMEDSESDHSCRRKERVFDEKKTNFVNNGFQRTEKKEILVRDDSGLNNEYGSSVDRFNRFSEREFDDQWTPEANRSAAGVNKSSVEETSTTMTRPSKVVGSLRTRPRMDWSSVERDNQFEGLYGSNSSVSKIARKPNISYADVAGPSNYDPYAFHGRSRGNVPGEVEKLELERAELIRKLDELKEQLDRSYPASAVPKEREPLERNFPRSFGNQDAYNAAVMRTQPFVNCHNIDAMNFYSPRTHNLNKIPEYEDSFQPQMTKKPNHYQPHQYPHVSPHEYYPGHYRNFDPDPFGPYPHGRFFHAPTCSCSTCYPRVLPPYGRGPVNHNSNFYRHDDPIMVEPPRHMRRPIDLDPEIDSHYHLHPRKTAAGADKIERCCRPIAGGAPFILCMKCFELLKIPTRKLRTASIHKQKVRCGACSAVILLKVENEKLVASHVTELKHTSAEALNDDSIESSGSLDANSCSEDFRKSSFNFHSAVSKNRLLVEEEDERLNLDEPEKGLPSSPSISSREEESTTSVIAREDLSEHGEMELPFKSIPSPVPPRSPMWQESNERAENEGDDKMIGRINYRDDLVRDLTTEATELDVSFDEYQHNMSHDFAELSKEDYRLRLSKGSDSFLVGFIKKSLRDISRSGHSMETERPKVYINGHPLLDRVVKRAEKFAGPIRPGDYWYDYKAGFWGVMGQPCLGIIPPCIEEFNYPMPTNCGAGNTSVYVNGRELNQRDLDLLASRGLPTTRNKFYIIEISGKVIDEDTGKELDNLGKLAPTVERVKHGFGMKVPRPVS